MKNNSTMAVLSIVVVLVIIVGVTASVVSIFRAKEGMKEVKENSQETNITSDDSEEVTGGIFEASSKVWSIEYSDELYARTNTDVDSLHIKSTPFEMKLDVEPGIKIFRSAYGMDAQLSMTMNAMDYTEEEVYADGVKGVKILGEVKEDGESMYPPGTKMLYYFFELGENDTLEIRVDDENLYDEADKIVSTLKFDLEKAKISGETMNSFAVSNSGNIKVTSPLTAQKVSSPFVLSGQAIAFEGTVNYRLSDSDGNILDEGFMTTIAPDIGEFGDFNHPITFSSTGGEGLLEVFTISAKDGSEQDVVKIEVEL